MTAQPPQSQAMPIGPETSTRRASRGDKVRLALILGGIVAFLAVVLWMVRDNQSAGDLAVGTCFDEPGRDTNITTVTRRDCTAPHDAEVFHVAEYTGANYPISLSLDSFIEESCVPAFTTYVGQAVDESENLTIGYFHPSRDGWDDGDRTITCYAVRDDGAKLTTSVKGTGT